MQGTRNIRAAIKDGSYARDIMSYTLRNDIHIIRVAGCGKIKKTAPRHVRRTKDYNTLPTRVPSGQTSADAAAAVSCAVVGGWVGVGSTTIHYNIAGNDNTAALYIVAYLTF